jgi:replication-associated recombination protein RarA
VKDMPKNIKGNWKPKLIGNYAFDETASSLQKMIRRGKEYEACFWAYLFHQSGYGNYLWRRLAIICSEDVGNGNSQAAILVNALWSSWEKLHKHNKQSTLDKLLLPTQAILYMCRCRKSRESDSLVNLIHEKWKQKKRLEISEIAKDSHTSIGRIRYGKFGDLTDGKEKLRIKLWFKKWSFIENKAYKDKWEKELKDVWLLKAQNLKSS